MFKLLNNTRAAEGKTPYKTFSLNAVVDFLQGRVMPDGTVWTKVRGKHTARSTHYQYKSRDAEALR